jgi:hypothetical protein
MERIIRIEESSFFDKNEWSMYDGYQIITDKQTIKVGISNGQSCCEHWGYLTSEDDLKQFEGAKLLSIEVVDKALDKISVPDCSYGGGAMFVNIETSEGLLQFAAYNEHNGYYGHEAVVISNDLNHSEYL